MRSRTILVSLLALLSLAPKPAGAITMDDVAAQLSYRTLEAKVTLIVQRSGAEALSKRIQVHVEESSGGQNLLMVFRAPSNMKGTGFLALTKNNFDDEYYMYVRTLRRVKRVPNLSENFMLRDFLSLYFLKPRNELWDYSPAVEEKKGDKTLLRIEGKARSTKAEALAGYKRVIHWIEPAKRLIVQTHFLDGSGKVVRKQRVEESLRIGKVWVPSVFLTEDLLEGASARLEVNEYTLDVKFPDDLFSVRYLKTL